MTKGELRKLRKAGVLLPAAPAPKPKDRDGDGRTYPERQALDRWAKRCDVM